MKVNMKCKKM